MKNFGNSGVKKQSQFLLLLDLSGSVLSVGFAHCNIRLYGHGFERLVFSDVQRHLVSEPDGGYAIGRLSRLHVRNGIEKPIAQPSN